MLWTETSKSYDKKNERGENKESQTKKLEVLGKIDENEARTAVWKIIGVVPERLICLSYFRQERSHNRSKT